MNARPLDLDALRARLHDPESFDAAPRDDWRRAAVAAVLRGDAWARLELLLMRRAERAGDRWSGQVSLPGGHVEPGDADLVAAARRESREEVGLDPAVGGRLLGALPPLQARARGGRLPLDVVPFVFHREDEPKLALGPEADDAFWLPLGALRAGDLDAPYRYRREDGAVFELPSWRHEGRVVWGMTHRIVWSLLAHLDVVDGGTTRTRPPVA